MVIREIASQARRQKFKDDSRKRFPFDTLEVKAAAKKEMLVFLGAVKMLERVSFRPKKVYGEDGNRFKFGFAAVFIFLTQVMRYLRYNDCIGISKMLGLVIWCSEC